MRAEEFDRGFDDGEDVTGDLDLAAVRRPGLGRRRVNVDFPVGMIESLDREARRLGVTRQSIVKAWIAGRPERAAWRQPDHDAAGQRNPAGQPHGPRVSTEAPRVRASTRAHEP
jgi:hypothetical protein